MNGGGDRILNITAVVKDDVAVARSNANGRSTGEYAAFTMPAPPVARIKLTSRIITWVISMELSSIQQMMFSGSPAFSAASFMMRAASMVQRLQWDGRDQNGIAGFQTDQNLENTGRGGVRRGGHSAHDTHGLSDPLGTESLVLLDDAAGSDMPEVIMYMLGRRSYS